MDFRPLRALAPAFLVLALVQIGCLGDSDDSEPPPPSADLVPDFSVPDVNDTSPRFGENVSPRDYLGQVSAWYFGHST